MIRALANKQQRRDATGLGSTFVRAARGTQSAHPPPCGHAAARFCPRDFGFDVFHFAPLHKPLPFGFLLPSRNPPERDRRSFTSLFPLLLSPRYLTFARHDLRNSDTFRHALLRAEFRDI